MKRQLWHDEPKRLMSTVALAIVRTQDYRAKLRKLGLQHSYEVR